jgi:hypothetical protein
MQELEGIIFLVGGGKLSGRPAQTLRRTLQTGVQEECSLLQAI